MSRTVMIEPRKVRPEVDGPAAPPDPPVGSPPPISHKKAEFKLYYLWIHYTEPNGDDDGREFHHIPLTPLEFSSLALKVASMLGGVIDDFKLRPEKPQTYQEIIDILGK